MKKATTLIIGLFFLLYLQTAHGQTYDYLKSATATGNGITTDNSKAWTDLFSVTIDVTNVSYVMVTASINMRTDGDNDNAREGNYNIYNDYNADKSGVIKRQMIRNYEDGVENWGVGTLVHIFDVSLLSGNKTYTLEHSNQGVASAGRNVYSSARLTAVALTTATNQYQLSNDVKRIDDGTDDVTTTSSTYSAVTGTTTDAITLPINGDIFVIASINAKASTSGSVAEYKLESSTDGGVTWADLGKPVKRSMINNFDNGIVSLTCILQNQEADNDFQFRIAHKRVSGTATITTHNCNIAAVALTHSGGSYFPSFCSEVDATGVDITGVSTPPATVTSTTFTAAADIGGTGSGLFVAAQYLVSASNLDGTDRMRAGNQLYISGASSDPAEEYYRYIPDNTNFGAGGFIGLMTDLVDEGSYTIGMKHQIAHISGTGGGGDEILTTSEVILTGFQTYDQPRLSGSYDIGTGGDYTSLSCDGGLFAAINYSGLSGDVTINIISDITEDGTNELNEWSVGSSYTLTIQPDGTTLRTLSSTSGTPVSLNGADRVTIDGGAGKYLTFKCTNATPANTNAVIKFYDGATSNTITNCNIESNVQSFILNHPASAAIDIISSGVTAGDNEVTITNCNIYNSGASDPLGCGIFINSDNSESSDKNTVTISNNSIYNFAATSTSNVACGIYVLDEEADNGNSTETTTTITDNSFYCNIGTAPTSGQTAILIDGGTDHTVTGNYIGGRSASCGGTAWLNAGTGNFRGIEIRNGPTGTTYDVSNNTFQNINTSSDCWGYYNVKASVDFNTNTIGHASTTNSIIASTNAFKGVFLEDNASSSYVNTIESNTIANIQTCAINDPSWETTENVGIDVNTESAVDIFKNKIYKIGPPNDNTVKTIIKGINIYTASGTAVYTMVNNVVSLGAGLNTASNWRGIFINIPTGATANLYYNTIYLAGTSSTGENEAWGVYRAESCTFVSKNNIIYQSRSDANWGYYAYNFQTTGSVTSDNNILYAPGGSNNAIAYYDGAVTTLGDWQTASSKDGSSASQDPDFTDSSANPPDLYPTETNDIGTYLSSYLTDINGVTRDASTPDAGAYEYGTTSWAGTVGTDWSTAGNWSPAAIPGASDDINIPDVTNAPVIAATTSASCNDLSVASGATLTINSTSEIASGSLIVSGTSTGDVTYKRWMTADKWHIVSAPVETQDIGDLLDNSANSIAYRDRDVDTFAVTDYLENINDWGEYYTTNTGGNFLSGVGYLMRRQTEDGTVPFTGTVATGDVTVSVTKAGSYGWNAVGNPYTSAIGVTDGASTTSKFLISNAAILDDSYEALYVWDPVTSNYVIINNSGFTNNTGKTSWDVDYVQVGQGFIVRANAGGDVAFTTSMQEHQTSQVFKSAKMSWPGLVLKANKNEEMGSTLIAFNDDMTPGLDPSYDAGIFKSGNDLNIFTQLIEDNGLEFGLQCLPLQNIESMEIPIGLDATTAGEITLSIEKENFPESVVPVLNDKLLDTKFAFNSDGDVYTTTINGNTKGFGRFSLTFSSTTDAENIANGKQHFKAWFSNGKINLYGETMGTEIVRVYSISGQEISNARLENTNLNTIELPVRISGIYLIRIEKQSGTEVLKVPVLFN